MIDADNKNENKYLYIADNILYRYDINTQQAEKIFSCKFKNGSDDLQLSVLNNADSILIFKTNN